MNAFRAGRLDDLSVHPTVKPVALVADALRDCSRRGDIVLDPFMGSGTTIMAAERVVDVLTASRSIPSMWTSLSGDGRPTAAGRRPQRHWRNLRRGCRVPQQDREAP